MFDFLFYLVIGFGLGAIAGLIPGMHPNLIGLISLGFLPAEGIVISIVTMLVSSQFFELIKMVFLFVPEESNVLAMHPVFSFVKQGKGIIALRYCLTGLIIAFLISIIASPLILQIVPFVITNIREYVPFILLIVASYLVLRDKKRHFAIIIFILAGIVGYFGLNSMNQPLLVLLTGFFAIPVLLELKQSFPKQILSTESKIEKPSLVRGVIAAFISSLMLVFLPAVGPAQASVFSRGILKKIEDFFVAIGAISGFDVIFSIILLFTIGKARIGILESFGHVFTVDLNLFVVMMIIALLTSVISYFIVFYSANRLALLIPRINYKKLSYIIIAFLTIIIFLFDGFVGLGFFVLAGLIGIVANKFTNSMTHCMGSLIIPTIIYLLF